MQRYLEKARSTRLSALSLKKGPAPPPESGPKAAGKRNPHYNYISSAALYNYGYGITVGLMSGVM